MPLHLGKDLEKILESFLLAFGKQETAHFIAMLQPMQYLYLSEEIK